jgi:predicted SPOUT superfamily RNA methylase MTH1
VSEPSVLFDLYVNTCPGQGSRTIRTEVSSPVPASSLGPQVHNGFRAP